MEVETKAYIYSIGCGFGQYFSSRKSTADHCDLLCIEQISIFAETHTIGLIKLERGGGQDA